jgi:hypothetical protein
MLVVRREERDARQADALGDGLERRQLPCRIVVRWRNELLRLQDGCRLDLDLDGGGWHDHVSSCG